MTIDRGFVDKLTAILKEKLDDKGRAQIENFSKLREARRASIHLVQLVKILHKHGEHLSEEIKDQMILEHLNHANLAVCLETIVTIVEMVSDKIQKVPEKDFKLFAMFGLELVEIGKWVQHELQKARRQSAETVLQNLADLFPEIATELTKRS